ncbi:unnamed protein product [Periconia digitata]|uniref:Rhodopsin domain-containing protein n=1 Tax=Periconia digitata TaxID=1303443 RepID=A0A9W4XE46_9PLEO|nr:unnamed protein product [Periconia digitata]
MLGVERMILERAAAAAAPRPSPTASFVNTALMSVAISLPIVATTCVILRLMTKRWKINKASAADDWCIIFTLLMCWGHSINTFVAAGMGGINTITVPPRLYVNIALRALWLSTFFLVTALYTVKISILLFYWHIFYINERFRKACIVMMVILTMWWISSMTCAILVSDPIGASFHDAARAKHRYDFNAWYLANSGISIVFDITILCFPIPVIRTLRVDFRRKLSIIGIFWLGAFVCVSAIVRFVLFYNTYYKLDPNYSRNTFSNITYAFIWAEIEPNCSVIAACLPTYGPYFKADGIVPKFISNVKQSFGMSTSASSVVASKSGQGSSNTPSNVLNSYHEQPQPSGAYVELEKMDSSQKGAGEIVVERKVTVSVDPRERYDLERGEGVRR